LQLSVLSLTVWDKLLIDRSVAPNWSLLIAIVCQECARKGRGFYRKGIRTEGGPGRSSLLQAPSHTKHLAMPQSQDGAHGVIGGG